MQTKTESLALKVLERIETSRTTDFSTVKELLGSDDKAGKALRYLLENGKIVELDRNQWKSYGISERDKRKKYYVLVEDDFANREWSKVKEAIEKAIKLPAENPDEELLNAIMAVLPMPGGAPQVTKMSRYRNKNDIDLLIKLYRKLTDCGIDSDYTQRCTILEFIHGSVLSGTLKIGDMGKKDLSVTFQGIAHDAMSEMSQSKENALNIASPMAAAFVAFQIAVSLNQSNIITWIDKELNKMLDMMDSSDVSESHNVFIFQHLINYYRRSYPEAFRIESVDNLSLKLLEIILDRKTTRELRNALQAVRKALVDPMGIHINSESKHEMTYDG